MADIAGLEAYASVQQDGRNTWQSVAAQLGRQLSATPSHLSRALYVPRHDSSMSHLPLYDISTRYADAVGDLPIGSSKYAVKLGLMQRPRGDGGDDIPVLCNAHISPVGDSDMVTGSVQYRGQPTEPCPEVGLYVRVGLDRPAPEAKKLDSNSNQVHWNFRRQCMLCYHPRPCWVGDKPAVRHDVLLPYQPVGDPGGHLHASVLYVQAPG